MRLPGLWARSAATLLVLSGAAFAEVTVSQSNDPTAIIGGEIASLLRGEITALRERPPTLAPPASPSPKTRVAARADARPGNVTVSYDRGWLDAQSPASGGPEWHCLTQALYFEARGESLRGQFAVAEVILNRVDSPRYPGSVCNVVRQGSERRNACQFSYTCDGAAEVVSEPEAWDRAGKIARIMLDGAARHLTSGATHFHTRAVRPSWSRAYPQTAQIGMHLFYRHPGARPEAQTVTRTAAKTSAEPKSPAAISPGI